MNDSADSARLERGYRRLLAWYPRSFRREDEIDMIGGAVVIGLWLWLAWANGRGHDWARPAFMAFFAFTTLGVLVPLGQGAATYAPADLIAGAVLWLTALAAMVLIAAPQSAPYYNQPAQPERAAH